MKRTILTIVLAALAFGSLSAQAEQSGPIAAWGWNDYGQCDVPEPNSGFAAIAAGKCHSLGLKDDGSVAAWGFNMYGQCNVPAPNSGFIAIAGGANHSLGFKDDGSVAAWGRNDHDQCNIPAPNSGFTAIATASHHSLGLKEDGSVAAWGWNPYGQCDVPEPNSSFVAIAAGGFGHSLGLKVCQYKLIGDINNDCKVDLLDFAVMANNWLIDCNVNPGDPACVPKGP